MKKTKTKNWMIWRKNKKNCMNKKGNMFYYWNSAQNSKKVSRKKSKVIKRFFVQNSDWIFTRLVSIWLTTGRIPIRVSIYFKRSTGNIYIENDVLIPIKRQIKPYQFWLSSLTETKRLWYVEGRTTKWILEKKKQKMNLEKELKKRSMTRKDKKKV